MKRRRLKRKDVETYKDANPSHWDSVVEGHYQSDFYDVKGFMAVDNKLDQIELSEIVKVSDRSLLHMQSHFGLTTLPWARLGAKVTGVDLPRIGHNRKETSQGIEN